MKRKTIKFLQEWLVDRDRIPLVIRGARQVGKTWLVRELARISGKKLVEINFERTPQHRDKFYSNEPQEILLLLGSALKQTIATENCLLFLDEIQMAPEVFAKLRWFAELLPELPVIAAGSLLEFMLTTHTFSMPVGRIEYLHVEPLSFEEFLLAVDHENLHHYLQQYTFNSVIPESLHQQFMQLFKEYLFVGGLPKAVDSWRRDRILSKVSKIHLNILATYRDDFSKYRGRLPIERLEDVMNAVPKMLGEKCVYSRINKNVQAAALKKAIDLLEKARVCHTVTYSSANGLPLGAESNDKYFKEIFMDVGLCSSLLGLPLHELNALSDITLVNHGGIAEQVVGQLLRTVAPHYVEPKLFCWIREEKSASAEIDYVISHKNKIIPIEVKSGTTGSLKSLHLFMASKKLSLAVRINADSPSKVMVPIKNQEDYLLMSIPFYLIEQIHRLL